MILFRTMMMRLSLLIFLVATSVKAQDLSPGRSVPTKVEESKGVSPLRRKLDDSIKFEQLYADENSKTPMTSRIVMRWANNARGSENGATVFYFEKGRPEAVNCVYPWEDHINHEFDSLSRGTFIAKNGDEVVWQPKSPGLEFKAVPDAPLPADSPVARLRQLKELAAQFSSTMLGWKADKSDREALRMLPQPLYRYESQRPDILDGAVFAFVQGTDPESILLLEAFKTGNRFEWQFAFARRTSGELEARFKGVVVWHVAPYPIARDPRSTHLTLRHPLEDE